MIKYFYYIGWIIVATSCVRSNNSTRLETEKSIEVLQEESINFLRLSIENNSYADTVILITNELFKLDSNIQWMYQNLIDAYRIKGDYHNAENVASIFISKWGNEPFAYIKRAEVHLCIGDKTSATIDLMKAAEMYNRNGDFVSELMIISAFNQSDRAIELADSLKKVGRISDDEWNLIKNGAESMNINTFSPCNENTPR